MAGGIQLPGWIFFVGPLGPLVFPRGEEHFGNTLSRESVICSQADLEGQSVFYESPSTENNSRARM